MSSDTIKQVLETGSCPTCNAEIQTDDKMTRYVCINDESHFRLEVTFHGGESITAKLNDVEISSSELQNIDW